jgi:transcriptional regulator with XRE-family HTH domain
MPDADREAVSGLNTMAKRTITKTDMLVARNIKRLRGIYGLTRRELEEKAAIAYGILDQIETFHKPAGKTIQKRITDALTCPLTELYAEETPRKVKEPTSPYLTSRQRRILDAAEHLSERQIDEAMDFMAWLLARKHPRRKRL